MKNSKLLIVLLSALLVSLSGCSNAIDQKDLKDAKEFCAEKEGVYKIWINGTYGRTWECKNGDTKDIIKPA
jgi:hypothetical protein